jgi:DNA-binding transcriptional LysR family regulator
VELRQLEAFVAAAQRGSISRAAQALFLTQPSLTQRVRALELDLGQQLLVRAGRGVRLTPAGRMFLPRAEAALAALRRAAEEIKTLSTVEGGRLALAAAEDAATYVLPAPLGRFCREHPSVDLALHTGESLAMAALVAGERAELAVVTRSVPLPELTAKLLHEERLVPVVASDHPLAAQERVSLESFAVAGLVTREPESDLSELVMGLFEQHGLTPRLLARASSTEVVKRLIAAGVGVGLLPELSIADGLASGRLTVLRLEKARAPRRGLWLVQREGEPLSTVADAFLRLLIAEGLPRPARARRAPSPSRSPFQGEFLRTAEQPPQGAGDAPLRIDTPPK